MKRDVEVILLALNYYTRTRGGTAGAMETKEVAEKIMKGRLIIEEKKK